jgi:hypothetical protein
MISKAAVLLSVLLFAAPDPSHGSDGKAPVLKLTASPRIGEVPAKIQFHAFIAGGRDDDSSLYCPDVEWDFKDAVFRDTRDCPEYQEGTRIQRAYETDHTFETVGVYDVEVRLIRRERVVLKGHIEVRVQNSGLQGR